MASVDLKSLNKPNPDATKLLPLPLIFAAYKRLTPIIERTELQLSIPLSDKYKAKVYLKREDLQVVGTYKVRGVFNKISQLSAQDKHKGITCASIGNHAQSVAFVCAQLKIHCRIFMPNNTAQNKINSVKDFGKEYLQIEMFGDTFDECLQEAMKNSEQEGTAFVHAFDDEQIIAGQGTLAIEMLEDAQEEIDILLFPVGGGSVGSGLVSHFKQVSPNTILVGCEPENAPSMHMSLKSQQIVDMTHRKNFSDTVTTKKAGKLTFSILSQALNDVILVPEGQICSTMIKLFNEQGMLVERAGALTVGALEQIKDQIVGKRVVCLISGLNSDLTKMNDIRMLSEMHKGVQYYLFISFYTKPGAMKQFLLQCLTQNDEITHFDYTKKNNREKGPALVGIRVKSPPDFEQIKLKMDEFKIQYKILNPNQEIFRLLL